MIFGYWDNGSLICCKGWVGYKEIDKGLLG